MTEVEEKPVDQENAENAEEEKQPESPLEKKPVKKPKLGEWKVEGIVKEYLMKDKKQLDLHQKLYQCQNVEGTESLALHIKKVFGVLIDSYPNEALDKLEEVSYLIKKGEDLNKFLALEDTRDYKAQAADLVEYLARYKSGDQKEVKEDEDGEAQQVEAEEVAPVGLVQDLMKDIRLF